VRGGLRALIEAQEDMVVVGEAEDGEGLAQLVSEARADVLVVDAAMPRADGATAVAQVLREVPGMRILALSGYAESPLATRMLVAGAHGYVVKSVPPPTLIRAIRVVAEGGAYVDPEVAGLLLGTALREHAKGAQAPKLSEREAEVLRLIARGHTHKEIAALLNVSARTVETYRLRAMEKLGLRDRVAVIRYAAERGWLAPA
jgi:DNA-binding NarL/FixJ family response regulator